jgi:tRNA(Ile)-lysidine synthase
MLRRARSVLVAVSGGADSLTALLVLQAMGARAGFSVTACHFDHQLRPESRAGLEWVRAFCDARRIPCLSGEGDVAEAARRSGRGIEDAARQMRYQFLSFVAGQKQMDAIVTGHTSTDQVETVMLRVLRGSGIRGLRGMLPVSDVPGGPQRLLRPLLCATRTDTEAYCAEAGITPLADRSNTDSRYARNRLRLETLPALRALNPSLDAALLGIAASARDAFAGIEREAFALRPEVRGPVGAIYALDALAALQPEARTLVVEREAAFYRLGVEVNRTRVQNLGSTLRAKSGRVAFGATVVEVSCGRVRIGPSLESERLEPRILNVPGATVAGPYRVTVRADDGGPARLDLERVSGAMRVRSLAHGDRIRWHGLDRKVNDALATLRIPSWERAGAVAIADATAVHAVFLASTVITADVHSPDPWSVAVETSPPR